MEKNISENIVQHGVEPRPVHGDVSGQGQVRVWLGDGTYRLYNVKDGIVDVDGIKVSVKLVGDFLSDVGLEVVGVEYFEDEEVQ